MLFTHDGGEKVALQVQIWFFQDMLEDLNILILGQQLNLFVYPETPNGETTVMGRMDIKLTFTEQSTKQVI